MKQIFLSLSMIFFINGFVETAEDGVLLTTEYFPLSFGTLQTILDWGMKLHEPAHELLTNPSLSKKKKKLRHIEMKNLISELDNLENKMDIIAMHPFIPNEMQELDRYMRPIDKYYDDSIKHGFCKQDNATMLAFFNALISGPNNLLQLLAELYRSINVSTHVITEENPRCIENLSSRHILYFVYTQIMLTEMKGFATLQQAYVRRVTVDEIQADHTSALITSKEQFEKRLKDYNQMFIASIASLPLDIYRCPKVQPKRGVDFMEVLYFSRLRLIDSGPSCVNCEGLFTAPIDVREKTVYNCKTIGSHISVCPAVPGSHRQYLWLENQNSTASYGLKTQCVASHRIIGVGPNPKLSCPFCACSVDLNRSEQNYDSGIWLISITDQISDIWNNMVVTGIKFVIRDNAIHLQIQQAKFSDDALSATGVAWKELDVGYDSELKTRAEMKYEPLRYNRKSLYLDDIKLPAGHVVTGVRFTVGDISSYMLQVHGTPFDLETAELNGSGSKWFDITDSPSDIDGMDTPRSEIEMDAVDDPTKVDNDAPYNPLSNKQRITFTHTDLVKDAGQTTIPFLDAQPVEGKLPFPLSGVGLFYRGKTGYGGYVTPRTFILDIVPYLNMTLVHNEPEVE